MTQTKCGSGERWKILGICFFIALAVWTVFGQTLGHKFVNFDDSMYVFGNPKVTGGLTFDGIIWMFSHYECHFYHPMTMLSLMLDSHFYGLNAGGYHFTSALLHAMSAILLFLVLHQMTTALWRSAFVALLFAIHPLNAESVAWVAERKEVLSGFFFVLTLMAYVRYARSKSVVRHLCVVLLFGLGLMSKPTAVTLPFVLLLLDYWPLERFQLGNLRSAFQGLRPLVLEKIPLFLLAAVASVLTVFAERDAMGQIEKLSVSARISNALVSYATYLRQLVYPAGLAPFYPHPGSHLPWWKPLFALVLLVGISLGAFRWREKHSFFLTGWLWYLGMLVPMIGIVQVGSFAHADRFMYLPQIGIYLLAVWGMAKLTASWHRRGLVSVIGAVLVVAVLIASGRTQTSYWRDSRSLWTHTLACTSNNSVAHNGLGMAFLLEGRPVETFEHFQRAIEIQPDFAIAHNNLGGLLRAQGRLNEALDHFQKAVKYDPDYADAHFSLGLVLAEQNRPAEEVARHFQRAIEIRPDYAEAHANLGAMLVEQSRFTEAIEHFQKALQLKPNDANARCRLATALYKQGKFEAAKTHYQQALNIDSKHLQARICLAWLLATCPETSLRNGRKAVNLAEQADHLSEGKDAEVKKTLAAAYAESGDFTQAVAVAQQAMQLAATQNDVALSETLRRQISFYQAGLPLRGTNVAER